MLRTIVWKIRHLWRRDEVEARLQEEMQLHLDELAAKLEQRGMTPQDARREARRQFGNVTQTLETHRRMRGAAWLEDAANDLRLAVRMLMRTPGLALVAIVAIALGVGANTAVFSMMDQVLYRLLPVKEPERLVRLHQQGGTFGQRGAYQLSYPMYRDLREGQKVFSQLFARFLSQANLSMDGISERVWVEAVSGNFYQALGLSPQLGRLIDPSNEREPGVVLTHSYWKTRFDSNPAVLGKTVVLNNQSYTVIGVSAPGFEGMEIHPSPQMRVPAAARPAFEQRTARIFNVYARLAGGISMEQAQAGLQPAYRAALEEESAHLPYLQNDSESRRRYLTGAVVLRSASQGDASNREEMRMLSLVLLVIVTAVLLIACANIANLLLARATARQKEIAVRLALGASRWRLIRQLLVESTMLSITGGLAGLGVSYLTLEYALTFAPPEMPTNVIAAPDLRVLLFNLSIAALTGLVFGLFPALAATKPDVAPVLKDQAATASGSVSQHWLRKFLVTGQIALSLTLLIVAALLAQSLRAVRSADPGFRTEDLIVFNVSPTMNGYSDDAVRSYRERMAAELRRDPAVVSVGQGKYAVLSGQSQYNAFTFTGTESLGSFVDVVDARFFHTLGMRVLAGRAFREEDVATGPRVAMVNEAFVKNYMGGGEAVGRSIAFAANKGTGTRLEVVGVVKNAKTTWVKAAPDPQVYLAAAQENEPGLSAFYVRYRGNPSQVYLTIRNAARKLDANLPIFGMRTMDLQFDTRLSAERLTASMATGFGSMAGILAMVGLYGVMSFLVSRRTSEIGIRMTLGASRRSVIGMVLREALVFGGAGVVLGVLMALASGRFLKRMLFGLSPQDPPTLLLTAILMLGVTMAAAFMPAWRASRVDPLRALRHD
ncbi:MAG: ABC transporter permease [Bryobacterales bacterium]|nr:ABC transporter permease [Bryobacterales bacterium]